MAQLVLAHFFEEPAERDARVVHERVDPALLGKDARDGFLALLRHRDVERDRAHVEPARALAQVSVGRRITQTGVHDVAPARRALREQETETGAAAGDENDHAAGTNRQGTRPCNWPMST